MSFRFSYQHFTWSEGTYELSPVQHVHATSPAEAASILIGAGAVGAGAISQVALKVWGTGRARTAQDVKHFWRGAR